MCDEREQLIGYVYGECDADEHRRVTGHLEDCETCQQEIGALRRVREDLLAWDVPRHESVWKPFAPARTTVWWREVPAWGLAAAASLTFMVGAAGGVATQALFGADLRAEGMSAGQAATPAVTATPISVSDAEYLALVDRLQRLEAALGEVTSSERLMNVSTAPAQVAPVPQSATASAMHETDNQLLGLIENLNNDVSGTREEFRSLRKDFNNIRDLTNRVIYASTSGVGGR